MGKTNKDVCGGCGKPMPSHSSSWSPTTLIQTSYCEGDTEGQKRAKEMANIMRKIEQQDSDERICTHCGWSKVRGNE